ncbi:MAG: GDP-mannose 4,6-dehydratase [Candidatus Omnitrophica bacterium]|nr:GDP-mannose 4,6-dehydratase [Candidatus Omnitrophota bacterium]
MKSLLVTGAAGFVGAQTAKILLKQGYSVVGVDNLNDYYNVRLKQFRLKNLMAQKNFTFHALDIEQAAPLQPLFKKHHFSAVINLAARAGVRYSLVNPYIYNSTNSLGTLNLLELCKEFTVKKFVLASTSSLYAGQKMPFREDLPVNTPISYYAASKKSAEMACYTYHYLFNIDVTILRYFTVYGPAGRPDMSLFRFIQWIYAGKPIELFGDGTQSRDFTYIDDIADGTVKALKKVGFEIINLGGNAPYDLKMVIRMIEAELGKKAKIQRFAFPKTDVRATWADINKAKKILNWKPTIPLAEGIKRTVDWHLENQSWLKKIKL